MVKRLPLVVVVLLTGTSATFLLKTGGVSAQSQLPTGSQESKFGTLPPGATTVRDMSGVRAEIAVRHLIDPSLVSTLIPEGFQPLTARDQAKRSLQVGDWLKANPECAEWLLGSLGFVSLDSLVVDGRREGGSEPVVYAFWWIVGTAVPPLHRGQPGGSVLQIATWHADSKLSGAVLQANPTTQFVPVQVKRSGSQMWTVRLELGDGEIVGECVEQGSATEAQYSLPAYTTMFLATPHQSIFSVFTYYGHRTHSMQARWIATGRQRVARGLSENVKRGAPMSTRLQDGWQAREGVYRQ